MFYATILHKIEKMGFVIFHYYFLCNSINTNFLFYAWFRSLFINFGSVAVKSQEHIQHDIKWKIVVVFTIYNNVKLWNFYIYTKMLLYLY